MIFDGVKLRHMNKDADKGLEACVMFMRVLSLSFLIILTFSYEVSAFDCSVYLAQNPQQQNNPQDFIHYVFKKIWKKEPSSLVLQNMEKALAWNTHKGHFSDLSQYHSYKVIKQRPAQGDSFQYLVRTIHHETVDKYGTHRLPSLAERLDETIKGILDPDYLNVYSSSLINQGHTTLFSKIGVILDTEGSSVVATAGQDLFLWGVRAEWKMSSQTKQGYYLKQANGLDTSVFYPTQQYVKEAKNTFDFDQLSQYEHQLGVYKKEHEFAAALLENRKILSPEEILQESQAGHWNEIAFLGGPTLNNPKPVGILLKSAQGEDDFYFHAAQEIAKKYDIPLVIIEK